MSNCSGRVGKIVDTVRDLFNEAVGEFLPDDFIVRAINRCLAELAQSDYWNRETWIACVYGSNEVDLLAVLPDLQDVHRVRYSGCPFPMTSLGSYKEYDELRCSANSVGIPEYYVIQQNTMFVWPPPSSSSNTGFCLYHSYMPPELTCSSANPNPPVPAAHDLLFAYYALKQAFLRDRHAPGADMKFQEYSALYEHEKYLLLAAGDPPVLSLRPGP